MITSFDGLIAFLRHRHRESLDQVSGSPVLVPANLPHGLANIYREFGRLIEIVPGPENGYRAPFASQDRLLPVDQLQTADGMVEFALENQGNWSCRCPIDQPDPAVYSNALDLSVESPRGFVVICKSLKHFLTTFCLQEAIISCRNMGACDTQARPSELLQDEVAPLWLNGWFVHGEPTHHFFTSPDNDYWVMQNYVGIFIGSQSRPVAELVRDGFDFRLVRGE